MTPASTERAVEDQPLPFLQSSPQFSLIFGVASSEIRSSGFMEAQEPAEPQLFIYLFIYLFLFYFILFYFLHFILCILIYFIFK